jgi:hypothetical protein
MFGDTWLMGSRHALRQGSTVQRWCRVVVRQAAMKERSIHRCLERFGSHEWWPQVWKASWLQKHRNGILCIVRSSTSFVHWSYVQFVLSHCRMFHQTKREYEARGSMDGGCIRPLCWDWYSNNCKVVKYCVRTCDIQRRGQSEYYGRNTIPSVLGSKQWNTIVT